MCKLSETWTLIDNPGLPLLVPRHSVLDAYYRASRDSPDPSSATYMLTGEVIPPASLNHRMDVDVDMGLEEPDDDSELVPLTKITLVGEQDLKSRSIYST